MTEILVRILENLCFIKILLSWPILSQLAIGNAQKYSSDVYEYNSDKKKSL